MKLSAGVGDHSVHSKTVNAGAFFHDLGKLDGGNQAVLMSSAKEKLPVNHVDAGTSHLLKLGRLESSVLAFSHHIGLPNFHEQLSNGEKAFRDVRIFEKTNELLDQFIEQHKNILGDLYSSIELKNSKWTGLTRRIALSCLVDGDHTDTATHYGNEEELDPIKLQAKERLAALDNYVSKLKDTPETAKRNELRREIYQVCRDSEINSNMWACDSPVGTGKTTAIMAHLLKAADAKDLRHIFVVLPFTNIINQSVNVYRKALVLENENPEEIVAAHHHQADFESRQLRHLAQLWNAPITVTTAVQFFETLGSNKTGRLRKLHELPGSAILIDESHAAMPSKLWSQMWLWLKELAENWGCHIVFASGSLVRHWELDDFVDPPTKIPELVAEETRNKSLEFETNRVSYKIHQTHLNLYSLVNFVTSKPGPQLLILNSIQSAAVIADRIKKQNGKNSVLHLSTAIAPIHRENIIRQIENRLADKSDADWTLVATSCVEAGMNFSFKTAFRQRCGFVNLIQIAGRANRNNEYKNVDVWDFQVVDDLLPDNPMFQVSQEVLLSMFEHQKVDPIYSTEAIRREIQRDSIKEESDLLKDTETKMDYPLVAKLSRVINTDTKIVVIDPELVNLLEQNIPVSRLDITKKSVQIWAYKLEKLNLTKPIKNQDELLAWTGGYDAEFLGYMAGILPLIELDKTLIGGL